MMLYGISFQNVISRTPLRGIADIIKLRRMMYQSGRERSFLVLMNPKVIKNEKHEI
jgi:hypothetical protein